MKMKKYIIALLLFPLVTLQAQTTGITSLDSLTLSQILNEVIQNYPAIKKAQTDIQSSDAKIGMAKTSYLPDVNFSGSYAFIGPTSALDLSKLGIPGLGVVQMFPANNYSAMLNVSENIYDFGKTANNITFAKQNKELVGLTVELLKQKLSGMLVGNFYSIVFLQEAVNIKDEQLTTLKHHLEFVKKKVNTGSATNFEIISTKVRISVIENQKIDLENALKIQLSQLKSFIGKPQQTTVSVKNNLSNPQLIVSNDSLFNFAFDHRPEMKLAKQKNTLAETHLKMVNIQNNPSLNFTGSAGLKNGYIPDLNQFTPNFVLGIGLKVPIFDANRSKYTKIQAQTDIDGNNQDTELAKRNIVNEVIESKVNAESALKKVNQSELQLQQATQAYELAETNYKAGVITNLDLMDSYTSLSESKLSLFKTKIDYTVSLLKLKLALGETIY
jgi:outer membrane protein